MNERHIPFGMNRIHHGQPWIRKIVFVIIICTGLCVAALLFRTAVSQIARRTVSCPDCNVVILDIDTLREDALHCFDTNAVVAPNLCKLIRQSAYFPYDFSQSNWTLPSSLSTYTSQYPNIHGVWKERGEVLSSTTQTLASFFQHHGYQTYYSGQNNDSVLTQYNGGLRGYMHLNLDPESDRDWLSSFQSALFNGQPVLFHAYTSWLHMPYVLNPGELPVEHLVRPKGFPVSQSEFEQVFGTYLTLHMNEVFTRDTIKENPDIFMAPESVRAERMVDYFFALGNENDIVKRKKAWPAIYSAYMQYIDVKNPHDIAFLHMMYESKVRALDTHLAGFINFLLQPEISAHTIVILTSSHGEAFGEHGTFTHDSVPYNELYRVPLAIKYPHSTGTTIHSVVENIDLFPTIAELVTGEMIKNVQGVSLLPRIIGLSATVKPYVISINDNDEFVIQNNRYAAVFYRNPRLNPELYDVRTDPTEQHDIVALYPHIMQQFYWQLKKNSISEPLIPPIHDTQIPSGVNKQDLIRSGYF